jgi:GT2 family glycosyltransferase/glycosyltransferase involved in cell wall biosynthesis
MFDTDRFLAGLAEPLDEDETPLGRFLANVWQDRFLSNLFVGEHYAQERGERYSHEHNIVTYLRRASVENLSPHPGFDVEHYLNTNPDVRRTGQHAFLHFLMSGRDEGRSPHPTDGSLLSDAVENGPTFVPRPIPLEDHFVGEYLVERTRPSGQARAPRPLVAVTTNVRGASIAQREALTRQEVAERFRLDWPAASACETADQPTVSFLMPAYRPPLVYLDRAIRSILQQSCNAWQLCIVDDASEDRELSELLASYAAFDPRIKVATAQRNGGISRATNAALAMADGTYIALMDQDDMVTVDAVKKLISSIQDDPHVDWIYSDECTLDIDDKPIRLFSKPDWSPGFLLSTMYTGHLSVYRKALVEQVGGFRSPYDFSQDYDLALRVADTQPRVSHLQSCLYGWRSIPGSGAADGKPYARNTNLAALQDALARRGLDADAVGLPTSNAVVRRARARTEKVSIIIPSDSDDNIRAAVASLRTRSTYTNFEILVVTKSRLIERLRDVPSLRGVNWVHYDKPFNFSDKCNEGARRATGDRLVFFNDDVQVLSRSWMEVLLDAAAVDGVGAVGPKLLYSDGTIQHAGMVTGVRRLVGTAFHTLQADTGQAFGMAQFAREVSLLSGACIMVANDVFWRAGGFDALNAPINHSDVDLCLRIRAMGLTCVYTPFASLEHLGHKSLAVVDSGPTVTRRDKADIFLLKRWGREIAYDPYFPPAMRDLHYIDSQEPWELFVADRPAKGHSDRADVLLVSHDLTNSGAPRIVFDLATALMDAGCYVCVCSPTDGPMREALTRIGVDVVIDELLLRCHPDVMDFASGFDFAIANTAVTWPFVRQVGSRLPTYWYIHESGLIDHLAVSDADFLGAFDTTAGVWAGSPMSEKRLARHGISNVSVVPYGVTAIPSPVVRERDESHDAGRMCVGLFGSFEPRKGQDLAVLGVLSLPEAQRDRIHLRLFGRVLDPDFASAVTALAKGSDTISVGGELSPSQYAEELAKVDVVLVPSRDDTLPLVSLDALAHGKPLVVSRTTGTADLLPPELEPLILEHNSPQEIGAVLVALIDAADRRAIGEAALQCFEERFSVETFRKKVLSLLPISMRSVPEDGPVPPHF